MNWNELNSAWRCQATPLMAAHDLPSLKATFEKRRARLTRRLIGRNGFEAICGLVVCATFAWVALGARQPLAPTLVAIGIFFAVTVFFVTECFRIWAVRLAPDAPMLDKLNADIAELTYQRKLRLNVAKWYLTPMGIAIAVVLAAKEVAEHGHQRPWHYWSLAAYLVACGWLFPLVGKLNRGEVRRQIEPRLAELETLRQDVLASGR